MDFKNFVIAIVTVFLLGVINSAMIILMLLKNNYENLPCQKFKKQKHVKHRKSKLKPLLKDYERFRCLYMKGQNAPKSDVNIFLNLDGSGFIKK